MGIFKAIGLVLGILFVFWVISPVRQNVGSFPIVSAPPIPGTEEYETPSEVEKVLGSFGGGPRLSRAVTYQSRGAAINNGADKEYLVFMTGGSENISLANWKIESSITGNVASIGKGTYLPFSGGLNSEEEISVKPGTRLIINSGRSPIGTSFQVNKCTGFFEQFQDFTPPLLLQCPRPDKDSFPVKPNNLSDACVEYIERLPMCTMVVNNAPTNLGDACVNYLAEKVNYNTCINDHQNDPDFYKKEWRIYLNHTNPLWKERREALRLIDQNGNMVESLSF